MSTVTLSNIPYNCQVADIHRSLLMYGTAVDIQFNAHTSQAIVTMRTPQEAQALLNRREVNIRGSFVRVEPSHLASPMPNQHQHQHHMPNNTMGGVAPQQQQQQQQHSGYNNNNNNNNNNYRGYNNNNSGGYNDYSNAQPNNNNYHNQAQGGVMGGGASSTPRLSVVVEDCRYPITRDVLMQMFQIVAQPKHVYCGPSGPTTTGSVEFHDVASAERAMQQFNNNNIYPGCCFVKLDYEQPRNNYQQVGGRGGMQGGGIMPYPPAQPMQQQQQQQMPPYGGGPGAMRGGGAMMPTRGGRGGRGGRGAFGGNPPGAFDPMGGYGNQPPPPMQMGYGGRGGQGGGYQQQMPQSQDTTVVLYNIAETVPLYDVWVLLEVYGNVVSLKRQFKDKTNVSAQFQNVIDAKNAVFYLQNCPFRGRPLNLKQFLGYVERGGRTEWNAGPATDPATQAVLFTSGYHHRTKPSSAFNPLGRVRPGKNLYVSNLVESITDDDLKAYLSNAGFEVETMYRKQATVAIIEFKDTETAIDALVATHGKQVKDRYLRVTFSKFPPGPRPDGEAEAEEDNNEEAVPIQQQAAAPLPPAAVATDGSNPEAAPATNASAEAPALAS